MDPFQVIEKLSILILGALAAIILVIMVSKGMVALSKGAMQSLLAAIGVGIFLLMFADGKESLKMVEKLADGLASAIGL